MFLFPVTVKWLNVVILELWGEMSSVPVVMSEIISCSLFHRVVFHRDCVRENQWISVLLWVSGGEWCLSILCAGLLLTAPSSGLMAAPSASHCIWLQLTRHEPEKRSRPVEEQLILLEEKWCKGGFQLMCRWMTCVSSPHEGRKCVCELMWMWIQQHEWVWGQRGGSPSL